VKKIVATCSLLVACGSAPASQYQIAFATGERAEGAGRYAEAAHDFDDAAKVAPNAREKNHAEYAAAQVLIRAGDRSSGAAKLRAIADLSPPDEHSGEAAYEVANIEIKEGSANGWIDLENAMTKFPNEGDAHRALERLAAHIAEASGPKAAIDWLEKIAPTFEQTEIVQAVAYETAKRIEASGDTADARARYLAIADRWPYPHGAYWDKSLFHASAIDEKNGHFDDAISLLERMLHQREEASMLGSYERTMYEPAAWHIAEMYRDDLHDSTKAESAFHRVYAELTTSLKRDDALWEEAKIWRKDGDASTACSRLSTLVSQFPDSRYVPCITTTCSDVTRPGKSKAPKECPAYLARADSAQK
jgi:tetratricopeptide (TPR) repeat protein